MAFCSISLTYLFGSISYGATVNGTFMTENVDDVVGSDLFKITVGLTNLSSTMGLFNVCVEPTGSYENSVCNIVNASGKYKKDFPLTNCPSCIITVGTFVFPKQYVPVNSNLNICATGVDNQVSSCIATKNSIVNRIEDIVLPLR